MMSRLRTWIAGNRAAAVILALYLVLATAYNLADPLFEPPDELLHYDFVQYLKREGRLPTVDVSGPETEYHQPPLYYVLTALITAPLPVGDLATHTLRNPFWGYEIGQVGRDNKSQYLHGPSQQLPFDTATWAVHLTRTLSTLFGFGIVLLTYLLACRFFPKSLAVASMALVAFIPNFLLTSGAVSNDPPVILVSAAIGLIAVGLVARQSLPSLGFWIGLGVLLGLGLLTKLSAWPLLPLTGLAATLLAIRLRSWRVFVTAGLVLIACVVLLGGWWVARNLALYGDATGLGSMWAVWGVRKAPSLQTYVREYGHFRTTFWANFGYGNVPLPGWVYTILDALCLVGIAGLLLALACHWRRLRQDSIRRDQVIILAVWVVLTFGALVWYYQRTPAVTGRQLYPVLPAIAMGLTAGWAAFVPKRGQAWLATAIVGLMLLFAVGAWLGALVPAYRLAPRFSADEAELAIDHRLDWQIGDVATLLGYSLFPETTRVGEKVTLTLYWQPRQQSDRNYTVFVHLWGKDNELAGARDTYPGLGNDPTVYWTPGAILADAIPIPIAPDAQGPILLDIEAGLYDLRADERLPIHDADGNPVEYPLIGTAKLQGERLAQSQPAHRLDAAFEGGLVLDGYSLSATTLGPGSTFDLTLYWSPGGPLAADYTTFVHLVDGDGQIIAQGDGPPLHGRYPTTAWAAGERLEDTYALYIPDAVALGSYQLLIGLYNPQTNARLPLADGGDHVRLESAITIR